MILECRYKVQKTGEVVDAPEDWEIAPTLGDCIRHEGRLFKVLGAIHSQEVKSYPHPIPGDPNHMATNRFQHIDYLLEEI